MKKLLIAVVAGLMAATAIAQVPAHAGTDKAGAVAAPSTPPVAGSSADKPDVATPAPKQKKTRKSLVKLGGKTRAVK